MGADDRKHPEWCNYPVTNEGAEIIDMCWGLLYGYIKKEGESYCNSCEYNKKVYKQKTTEGE